MKRLIAPSGERTRILHIVSDSIPQRVVFTAERPSGGGPPDGTVEVVRRRWFARKAPETSPLSARQSFAKGFADVDYAIYVTPREDVAITFETRHFERKTLFLVLLGILVVAMLAAAAVPLL